MGDILNYKRMQRFRWIGLVAAGLLVAGLFRVSLVSAEEVSSGSYSASEVQFGIGQEPSSCSGSYCATASIGDPTVADSLGASSASFGIIAADSEPLLEMIVDAGSSNLGTLSTSQTATKTMVVRIRSYMSDGYTLQINGSPPAYDGYTMSTPTTPTASTTGMEQFGINVVANTIPSVGANPVQVPSDIFSFGQVMPDYVTPNLFKYIDGDVVASSEVESGQTDYTISMIVNISNATPAGHFAGDYLAIVVPRF